jgi:hypothetical protein
VQDTQEGNLGAIECGSAVDQYQGMSGTSCEWFVGKVEKKAGNVCYIL